MKKMLTYLRTELKRASRSLPSVVCLSLILCIMLGIFLGGVLGKNQNADDNKKVAVGIVGDASEGYLGFGISAIQSFDSSRFSMDLIEVSESEARKKLEKGELIAYIVIPEGFIDAAIYGEIMPLSYVTTANSVGIAAMFKEEILQAISCMVVESQNGIYAMQKLMRDHGIGGVGSRTDELCIQYFSLILNRSLVLKSEVLGISGGLSLPGYLICGFGVVLLLLGGLFCCPVFTKKDMALPRLLCASGHNSFSQILGEYISFFLMMVVNVSVMLGGVLLSFGNSLSQIPELANMRDEGVWVLALRFLPTLLAITALQFLLFTLFDNVVSSTLFQFLFGMGLAYISGCFYPIGFLPEGLQRLSRFTPTGVAREYFARLLASQEAHRETVILLAMFSVLLLAAVAVRSYRIQTK